MKEKITGNSKEARTLEYLSRHVGLTSKEAFEIFGDTRLGSTVGRLRDKGYPITSVWHETTNRFGEKSRYVEYRLSHIEEGV